MKYQIHGIVLEASSKDEAVRMWTGREDSAYETRKHIALVRKFLEHCCCILRDKGREHDSSKLESPEKAYFDVFTPRLHALKYGTPEYKKSLDGLGVALEHHYMMNRHHPEHFKNGMRDMNLFDLFEMLCDWCAATKRHDDGNIFDSIEKSQRRFGYPDFLKDILANTASELEEFYKGGLVEYGRKFDEQLKAALK